MTNPQAYRHKTKGTIAWIGRPYRNWKEIADVLDATQIGRVGEQLESIAIRVFANGALTTLAGCFEDVYYEPCFPITITELPEGWEPVEEILKRLAE